MTSHKNNTEGSLPAEGSLSAEGSLPAEDFSFAESLHFSRLDKAIASFLTDRCSCLEGDQLEIFNGIIKELSAALASGDSCILINSAQEQVLMSSGLVSVCSNDSNNILKNCPLILENSRLYLQRYWHYETRLANLIKTKVNSPPEAPGDLDDILDRYFPAKDRDVDNVDNNEPDWQKKAARNVAQQSFSIITGGPGTGKTTTILKILAILQEIEGGKLNIALAAPTGKAAMRLQESMSEGKLNLSCDDEIRNTIPDEVGTIHRLLRAKRNSIYFRHNAENPLVHDMVVIDEASMVDLALMSKLVDALKPEARLILLGDKDQLASVESGAILGDLSSSLANNTSELKKSFRFKADIKDLATAINQKDSQTAWQLLNSPQHPAIRLVTESLLSHIMQSSQLYFNAVSDTHKTDIPAIESSQKLEEIFTAYKDFQVLCSNRRGKWGVDGINQHIEQALQHRGVNTSRPWYNGKPVIITQNDPGTQLFNGDIGICLSEPYVEHGAKKGTEHGAEKQNQLYVYFHQADGHFKKMLPGRLPQHETAYALTIHKSQGSEFERVLMILPDKPNPVLSKELVYTAITRAKETVEVASSEEIFRVALSRQVERNSGLKEKVSAANSSANGDDTKGDERGA